MEVGLMQRRRESSELEEEEAEEGEVYGFQKTNMSLRRMDWAADRLSWGGSTLVG
jgi:hypothetical protein